jgi:nitroimidazol reductase NimA-like FMN-containing flavoprotein (pyridoxamine 5'-phosphate oxidase superfamily)
MPLASSRCYNRTMRRKDREITERDEIDALLGRTKVCRVAFAVDDEPYVVPLSHGYDPDANALFFHTAKEGRKIECIEANPRVCFEVEGPTEVKPGDERGCSWGVRYESVIGYGTIVELVSSEEKKQALRCAMRQQSGREADWTFAPKMVDATRVWRLDIESVAGKRSFKPEGD